MENERGVRLMELKPVWVLQEITERLPGREW
jgi:hypothetical protein